MADKEILDQAQKLYDAGQHAESSRIIKNYLGRIVAAGDAITACRLEGWNHYYMAIKGPTTEKSRNLEISVKAFLEALAQIIEKYAKDSKVTRAILGGANLSGLLLNEDEEELISVLSGLPLAEWLIGYKDKAWKDINDGSVNKFPDEPEISNTKSILLKWEKKFAASVEACETTYKLAIVKGDFRAAANAKHNKADALRELGEKKLACAEYKAASKLYKKAERVAGKSAAFHIRAVRKKLLLLRFPLLKRLIKK
jgi:hypothetical protein